MKSMVQHSAPNIVPGVHFTAQRFAELYAWQTALAADSVQLALKPFQYGLSIPYDGKASLSLNLFNNKLNLSRCCGLTAQGTIVALFEEGQPPLTLDLSTCNLQNWEDYYVVLEVVHGQRQEYGAESSDLPLRPLHSRPLYHLQVQAVAQVMVTRSDSFCIGKLIMQNGEWKLADYIPPCLHIGANPLLNQRYLEYQEYLAVFLNVFPGIIRQTDTYQEKSMIELREFCMQLGSLVVSRRYQYKHLSQWGSPFEMIELWVNFAQEFSFLLQCLTDRPGFYNLLNENTRGVNGVFFTPQSLDAVIQDVVQYTYHHNDIAQAIKLTDQFLQIITPVFKALGNGTLHPVGNKGTWTSVEEPKNNSITW